MLYRWHRRLLCRPAFVAGARLHGGPYAAPASRLSRAPQVSLSRERGPGAAPRGVEHVQDRVDRRLLRSKRASTLECRRHITGVGLTDGLDLAGEDRAPDLAPRSRTGAAAWSAASAELAVVGVVDPNSSRWARRDSRLIDTNALPRRK